ncbi:MAG TPA: bifunctional UDP-sugar hydrolase/5'-nucleotidase [Oscillospiraceae bacterium]|nr:bifunctional UDP-sugar hydrolase/5'-nucleotidase [Oscillospiraceae bacterium]HPF56225.1 bifunctional UDP-sugar hydrolase/5'-nucleotidase [Clostridiales bacterium]HPK35363.1 bifunctional UDP-sugar hydrolase/5'-nucleotidase [Oscillospiraceae bacterium]HPR76189.1 bifunctional UDP-sugar hydrolase/5'-nucleotidase [Oscillospiraceae bacterium]
MKKRIFSTLFCLLLLPLLFSGCSSGPELPNREIAVLFTNDVHCAVDDAIGYAGVAAYRSELESAGIETILVDVGDAIQGAPIGAFSKGENIISIMNALGYAAMVPGNHEFDYGVDNLVALSKEADFPFVSLNLVDSATGETVFEPYTVVEYAGVKIAFIGVSTPKTLTSSAPTYFMDENGNYIYNFMQDEDGGKLWAAVQNTVESAKKADADYVVALTHLGIDESASPYLSTELITHTTGIDAVLDGHSHSVIECDLVKNADGKEVALSSTGTELEYIGVLTVKTDGSIETSLAVTEEKDAGITALIDSIKQESDALLNAVAAHLNTNLEIIDPTTGVRVIRTAETNLGDLCADAYRAAGDADLAFANGGGIRAALNAGDVTYGDILAVQPFGNKLCKIIVTGQEILDALEYGVSKVPAEFGGFLQVSGLTFTYDPNVPSTVITDENGMFTGISGARRVVSVMIGDEQLDPAKEYTLVGTNYTLKSCGDGYTMFADNEILLDEFIDDYTALTDYISGGCGGNAAQYAEVYGGDRIIAK